MCGFPFREQVCCDRFYVEILHVKHCKTVCIWDNARSTTGLKAPREFVSRDKGHRDDKKEKLGCHAPKSECVGVGQIPGQYSIYFFENLLIPYSIYRLYRHSIYHFLVDAGTSSKYSIYPILIDGANIFYVQFFFSVAVLNPYHILSTSG